MRLTHSSSKVSILETVLDGTLLAFSVIVSVLFSGGTPSLIGILSASFTLSLEETFGAGAGVAGAGAAGAGIPGIPGTAGIPGAAGAPRSTETDGCGVAAVAIFVGFMFCVFICPLFSMILFYHNPFYYARSLATLFTSSIVVTPVSAFNIPS